MFVSSSECTQVLSFNNGNNCKPSKENIYLEHPPDDYSIESFYKKPNKCL